jgi:hypothetical protein
MFLACYPGRQQYFMVLSNLCPTNELFSPPLYLSINPVKYYVRVVGRRHEELRSETRYEMQSGLDQGRSLVPVRTEWFESPRRSLSTGQGRRWRPAPARIARQEFGRRVRHVEEQTKKNYSLFFFFFGQGRPTRPSLPTTTTTSPYYYRQRCSTHTYTHTLHETIQTNQQTKTCTQTKNVDDDDSIGTFIVQQLLLFLLLLLQLHDTSTFCCHVPFNFIITYHHHHHCHRHGATVVMAVSKRAMKTITSTTSKGTIVS